MTRVHLFSRRALLALAAATALVAACNGAGGPAASNAGDMAIGQADAKVTLVEYASVTCAHCQEFNALVWPKLKAAYVDTGKIRYIFRELPTAPEEAAVAGFQIARCGGADAKTYLQRVDVLFKRQGDVITGYTEGRARDVLLEIAQGFGLSEDQFSQCVSDPEGIKRIQKTGDDGMKAYQISGTPTFIINNEKYKGAYTYEAIAAQLDAKLAGR